MAKTLSELALDPEAKHTHDLCCAGFRSLLDSIDGSDPDGLASRAGNAKLFFKCKLSRAFLGPFLLDLREKRSLTLKNARNLDHMLRYLQRQIDKPIEPLHEMYLKLLLWENFVEIPAPLVLLANCLTTPRAASYDFDVFPSRLHGGPAKYRSVRQDLAPGAAVSPEVDAMLTELDGVFVGWLRNSVAHCSYVLRLDRTKLFDVKTGESVSFDQIRVLYERAFGYLEGFRKAVDEFSLEASGGSYRSNWGPNW